MDIANKHIVITGAARGLGFTMAEHIMAKGAVVSIVDIDPEAVEQAVSKLSESGKAYGYVANVADEASVESMFESMKRDHKEINGLINNAGILRDGLLVKQRDGQLTKMPLSQWQSVIDVNLTGVFLCGREAAAWMLETETKGVVINISSIAKAGNIGQTNYSAAKAGVTAMSVTWAKELARYGIRVADIAPGFIATEMTNAMKPEAKERVGKMVPLGDWGQPVHIAQGAVFILENDYYSGRTLEIDAALRL
ncbi:SDR family oxidoreductase [Reinekea marina]|uniref:SDR family NAD(P)-dependent oxidoreductase n=1 Tax=Reinekea marina TaxID=1310421 RepID=A0ABV7WMU2_9GAMM|nr:SDR family NAD(P)-dependent oxidoreductase [Reinekea marina]MDN3649341.1 SDR family oxidoreductase [Reinekea marina]